MRAFLESPLLWWGAFFIACGLVFAWIAHNATELERPPAPIYPLDVYRARRATRAAGRPVYPPNRSASVSPAAGPLADHPGDAA